MRATRFPLELPIRYRRVGDKDWSDGTTANISRSGVLFRGRRALTIEAEIEMDISLATAENGSPALADLICRGRVVRIQPSAPDSGGMFAATFSEYRVEPASLKT